MIDLVLAHHDEALDGLADLPAHCRVRLCRGREAGGSELAYLRYLGALAGRIAAGEVPRPDPAGWTVFAPADALPHAPSLSRQLECPGHWADVQPLGLHEAASGRPLRGLHFCPVTLAPLGRVDADAAQLAERYRRHHALDAGENLLAHFLDLAGLHGLAARAHAADLGVAAAGPVLAVRNQRLLDLIDQAPDAPARLEALLQRDPLYAPMLARCWLHLFGLPFVQLQPLPFRADRSAEAALEVPPAMARVVASIDALLARSAASATRRVRPSRTSPTLGRTGLRLSAIDELPNAAPSRIDAVGPDGEPAWWHGLGQVGQVGARLRANSLG